MGERRRARRYEVSLPVQVFASRNRPSECYTAQLKDISRSGIFFHSNVALDSGTAMELTFALPSERESTSVLVRASAKALRVSELAGQGAVYGVAASIDRIDFIRPLAVNAA
ncbi:MAG TPA: PilZ domain-containing protein [Candidatus Acidoferrales bacterium]|nr:PilZ domain-containing protein [Candidatus Acidoferrales bacterium]